MARVDLNPIEEARACAMLVDDLGITKQEVGRRVGKSRVAVSNLVRLLDLPDEALELIETGALSEGHGRAILTCKDHDDAQAPRPRGPRRRLVRPRDRAPRPRGGGPGGAPRQARDPPGPRGGARRGRGRADLRPRPPGDGQARKGADGARVTLDFDTPAEAAKFAEELRARRGGLRAA